MVDNGSNQWNLTPLIPLVARASSKDSCCCRGRHCHCSHSKAISVRTTSPSMDGGKPQLLQFGCFHNALTPVTSHARHTNSD